MSGEVETSQAELDLTALEAFLGGTRISNDLRLCSTTSTSSRTPDGIGDGHKDEGCQGIQDTQRIERDGEPLP